MREDLYPDPPPPIAAAERCLADGLPCQPWKACGCEHWAMTYLAHHGVNRPCWTLSRHEHSRIDGGSARSLADRGGPLCSVGQIVMLEKQPGSRCSP